MVCVAKVAVASRMSGAGATVAPAAVNVTTPEGAPAFAPWLALAALLNCAVNTVCPVTITGFGVAVTVPELATNAVTVNVIAGVGVVQMEAPVNVLQTARDAVVPQGMMRMPQEPEPSASTR